MPIKECPYCKGSGRVKFLYLFTRNCPLCYGSRTIYTPHIAQRGFAQGPDTSNRYITPTRSNSEHLSRAFQGVERRRYSRDDEITKDIIESDTLSSLLLSDNQNSEKREEVVAEKPSLFAGGESGGAGAGASWSQPSDSQVPDSVVEPQSAPEREPEREPDSEPEPAADPEPEPEAPAESSDSPTPDSLET